MELQAPTDADGWTAAIEVNQWSIEHRWDGHWMRGNGRLSRPIERIPMSRGCQYVEPFQPVYNRRTLWLPGACYLTSSYQEEEDGGEE